MQSRVASDMKQPPSLHPGQGTEAILRERMRRSVAVRRGMRRRYGFFAGLTVSRTLAT